MQDEATAILTTVLESGGLRLESMTLDRVEGFEAGLRRGYTVSVRDAHGDQTRLHCFVEDVSASQAGRAAEGAQAPVVLEPEGEPDSDRRVQVWLYPNDPSLPALPAATVPAAAEVLMQRLGIADAVDDIEVLSYRPGKRAVARVTSHGVARYLKIVRPDKVEALRDLHNAFLAGGLPVPRVLAFSPDGLLLLEAALGEVAARHLSSLAESDFLSELDRLRVRLAALPLTVPSRPGPMERYEWYCEQLRLLLPEQRDRINAIEAGIHHVLTSVAPEHTSRHGDLHLEQVMVNPANPGEIIGLIDLDTAGLGDPASDTAGFFAELQRRSFVARAEDHRAVAVGAAALAVQAAQIWSAQPGWRAGVAAHLVAHALTPASLPESQPLALQLLKAAECALNPAVQFDAASLIAG